MSRSLGGRSLTTRPPILISPTADLFEAGDHAQERGLPAARGADQDDEFPVLDIDVDAMHDLDGAEVLGNATDLNLSHGRSSLLPQFDLHLHVAARRGCGDSIARTLSWNSNVRVMSGFTSIAPDASMATQRGKT